MSRVSFHAILPGLACATGCLAEPPAELPAVSEVTSAATCTGFGCNDNSPIIAGAPFYELNIHGVPNDQGLKVTGFHSRTGVPFQLDVRQARLVGLDAAGNIALDTSGMTNAVIELTDKLLNIWEIKVVEIGSVAFWAAPTGFATTYHLQVHRPPGKDFDLCSNPPDPASWPGNVHEAIVYEGDRYVVDHQEVMAIGPATAGWFNIACAGTATAKLHLARHTDPSTNPRHPTTLLQRQAMLKAYTASVCPYGAFTGKGEHLDIIDDLGLMTGPVNFADIEAVWRPDGAYCKGDHWRLDNPNSMPPADALVLVGQLNAQCGPLPSCRALHGFPANWQQYGMVLTMNW